MTCCIVHCRFHINPYDEDSPILCVIRALPESLSEEEITVTKAEGISAEEMLEDTEELISHIIRIKLPNKEVQNCLELSGQC